jgi:hypothetical protein
MDVWTTSLEIQFFYFAGIIYQKIFYVLDTNS